ncbi:hypothetical protein DdX_03151 [Ditylenchus destructor]|uniref:Uncharacterized protein n=1 Tax=Ditylenchus destructor TaxID=166010 RepID=A0AAD4NHF4_9BILA|nr:hypothetical protein DdX_03151 [Ditylenchus destructor]
MKLYAPLKERTSHQANGVILSLLGKQAAGLTTRVAVFPYDLITKRNEDHNNPKNKTAPIILLEEIVFIRKMATLRHEQAPSYL